MRTIDATIELIIPDNTAFTVLTALRQLGYDNLEKVERSDHLLLHVDDGAEPREVVALLARAEVVFNPNKHRLSYALAGAAAPVDPSEYEVLVKDKDEDCSRLVVLLSGTFGMTALRGIEGAVGWRLYDARGPATRERLEWACRELLANSVSQHYDIRPRPVRTRLGEFAASPAKRTR